MACTARVLQLCRHCVRALELGVTRTHILPPTPGALIQELYTTDGIGTLMSRDVYDGIRLATAGDEGNNDRLMHMRASDRYFNRQIHQKLSCIHNTVPKAWTNMSSPSCKPCSRLSC